ncbi:MAG: hypothetical protein ACE5JS_01075 [Nitrospinota bacterium]
MKRLLGVLIGITLSALVATSPGFAHGVEDRPGGMGPGMMGPGFGWMHPMMRGSWGPAGFGVGHGMMGMGHGMMGMGRGMMGLGYGVTLTEEQQKRLTALRVGFLQDAAKAQAELIQARASLQALLLDPSAKDEAIEAQVQKAAAAHSRLFLLRFRMARRVEGLLTKEQREEMRRRFYREHRRMGPREGSRGMMNPCGAGAGRGMMNR